MGELTVSSGCTGDRSACPQAAVALPPYVYHQGRVRAVWIGTCELVAGRDEPPCSDGASGKGP